MLSPDRVWFVDPDAAFCTYYAKTNPWEDFAEHFRAYLLGHAPGTTDDDGGVGDWGPKLAFMETFLADLSANPHEYV